MDVKACDACKKLNTEVGLHTLVEIRLPSPGEFAKPSDPLIGFRLGPGNVTNEGHHTLAKMLCKPCAAKRITEMLASL